MGRERDQPEGEVEQGVDGEQDRRAAGRNVQLHKCQARYQHPHCLAPLSTRNKVAILGFFRLSFSKSATNCNYFCLLILGGKNKTAKP